MVECYIGNIIASSMGIVGHVHSDIDTFSRDIQGSLVVIDILLLIAWPFLIVSLTSFLNSYSSKKTGDLHRIEYFVHTFLLIDNLGMMIQQIFEKDWIVPTFVEHSE
ncbi:hypothetical protein TALC_00798 [Thermoplasmatales archaeon BRNA1]|nr:hypothetical protein TALC_00798 [Thermoplasmatales archaeon BRNA1]